jgi:hypothetical protein
VQKGAAGLDCWSATAGLPARRPTIINYLHALHIAVMNGVGHSGGMGEQAHGGQEGLELGAWCRRGTWRKTHVKFGWRAGAGCQKYWG